MGVVWYHNDRLDLFVILEDFLASYVSLSVAFVFDLYLAGFVPSFAVLCPLSQFCDPHLLLPVKHLHPLSPWRLKSPSYCVVIIVSL